jgi:hypothetical protein
MDKRTPFLQETLCVAGSVSNDLKYTRRPMGHLAERYRDASRSGVYRVTDAGVPRAAAGEAGAPLSEITIVNGLDVGALLEEKLAANVQVLIIEGDCRAHLAVLEAAARKRRERGTPFFAVLVDPGRRLDLPTLYKEKA